MVGSISGGNNMSMRNRQQQQQQLLQNGEMQIVNGQEDMLGNG